MHLVRTKTGIVEVPADVIGSKPWFLTAALWTRSIELCTDWRNGPPEKAVMDILVPDATFREMRARIEQFLYRKDPSLVDDTQNVSSEMNAVIDTLHKIDWQKMENLGLVKPGDEPESLIDMLTKHPEETLVKMRTLLEQMVNHAITALCSSKGGTASAVTIGPKSDLNEKIKCLQQHKAVQNTIISAMHTIRIAGNTTAHNALDIDDPKNYILATALLFVQVVEWFITSHAS